MSIFEFLKPIKGEMVCPKLTISHRDVYCGTMWKATLLALSLLVALVHKTQCSDGHSSFYGVKLCGREFIRAVIFTCGGSRWRRSGDSGKIQKMQTSLFL